MEIYKKTGVAGSGLIILTKSISTLIVSASRAFDDMTTERIRVEIERANGSNFEITKGTMLLKDFILANTYGSDAITSDENYDTIANCEICRDGSIHLFEKDVIKVELTGLDSSTDYKINGIEEPQTSTEVYSFEQKSMGADDTNKDFNVTGYDVLVLDTHSSIEEVNYTFSNGHVVKYDLFELKALSRSIDPVAYLRVNGTVVSGFSGKIQLPLFAVDNVNIRKAQGSIVNLILRNHI